MDSPPVPVPELAHHAVAKGTMVERAPALPGIVATVAERVAGRGGAALFIDYGHWRSRGDTLQALRGLGVRTCLLSNAGVPIRTVLDRDGLTPWYDAIVLSYEVGFVKPDVRIFEAALWAPQP